MQSCSSLQEAHDAFACLPYPPIVVQDETNGPGTAASVCLRIRVVWITATTNFRVLPSLQRSQKDFKKTKTYLQEDLSRILCPNQMRLPGTGTLPTSANT